METEKKYFAFISYKREDEEWAIWLQHEIESYHLPVTLNGRDDLPKEFRPVFRDIDELKAGNLPRQIYNALALSSRLIVICSPRSAKSVWVNKEISDFIKIGKESGVNNVENIFPFIVEGTPHSMDEKGECFPEALLRLSGKEERVGGNVNENGRDRAFVKVMAGMLPSVDFDMLWNRYERDKAEKERKEREERNKLLLMQSRFVAEKSLSLVKDDSYLARRLLLEVLPVDLNHSDRPFSPEVESALREACNHNTFFLDGGSFASYSLDGKQIVSASKERYIRIWDAKTGSLIRTLDGFADSVREVRFSPNGKQIASVSSDNVVRIIDAENGFLIQTLEGFSAAFCPDGKSVVSVSSDKTVKVWDVEKGGLVMKLQGHTAEVGFATYSADGKWIVSTSFDGTVKVWNAETGKNAHTFKGESKCVYSACFSPDGNTIVSEDYNVLKMWDVKSGELRRSIPVNENIGGQIHCVIFSPDGKLIASTSDNKVRIWEAWSGRLEKTIKGEYFDNGINDIYSVVFSPDGKNVMYCSNDKIWIKEIEPVTTVQILGNHRNEGMSCAVFSPDGSQIASGSQNFPEEDFGIRVWDANSGFRELGDLGRVNKLLEGHSHIVNSVAYSMDGKRLVSASSDHNVKIWDVETGALIRTLEIRKDGYIHAAHFASFSPDGKLIVTASNDAAVRIWNAEDGVELLRIEGHTSPVNSVFFSPDGKRIVSASGGYWGGDNTIRIWDVENGLELMRLKGHIGGVNSAAYSPDGNRIVSASSDNTIMIWSAVTGDVIDVLKGHSDAVCTAYYSPDGKRIVSASKDYSVKVWDVASGTSQTLKGQYREGIESAQFSPDGRYIVSASWHEIRIWPCPPLQDLIDQTRERFKDRPLTPEEHHQYYLE